VPRNVAGLRQEAVAFAARHGADERLLIDVALGVSEALTNAVVHAYAGRSPGTLELVARALADAHEVRIADDGAGLRRRAGPGLGLRILAHVTDGLSVGARDDGVPGTVVAMRFSLRRRRAGP
jgi:anti-sigma regulatory factor (Ser/Thr protein kinase)